MNIKKLLKGYTLPSFSLLMYLNSLTENEKSRCVVCKNEEVARVFRQIEYQGFTTAGDYRQLEEYYPYRRSIL